MSTTPENMPATPENPSGPAGSDAQIEAAVAAASAKKGAFKPIVAAVAAIAVAAAAFFAIRGFAGDKGGEASASSETAKSEGASGKTAGSQETTSGDSGVGSRTPEQIRESGYIRIGVFGDKAPFGYVDADGKNVGYDVEYGNRIAKDLGVKVEYVQVVADSRVEFLTSGKVDVVLANFTVTPERAEKVDFANPYMKVSLGAVSAKSAPITSEAQIAGKKVVVVKGTTADTYIEETHPEWNVTKYDQYSDVYNAMSDGRGDVWITDNTEALAFALQNSDAFTAGITELGPVDSIAAAVRKGNAELLSWLNEELVALGEENFFHAAYDKTLKPVYGDSSNPDDLVVEGGIIER